MSGQEQSGQEQSLVELTADDLTEVSPHVADEGAGEHQEPEQQESAAGEDGAEDGGFDIFAEDAEEQLPYLAQFDLRSDKFSVTKDELEQLPMAAKKTVHNLRKGYHDKARSLAEARRQFEQERAQFEQAKMAVGKEREALYAIFNNPDLMKLAQPPEGEPPDEYTPEGQRYIAKAAAAEHVQEFFNSLKKAVDSQNEEYQTQVAAQARAKREAQLQEFAKKHTDFFDHREAIIEMRKSIPGLTAEQAYYTIKGQQLSKKPNEAERTLNALGGGERSSSPSQSLTPPKGLTSRELYEWFQRNPKAHKATLERLRKKR